MDMQTAFVIIVGQSCLLIGAALATFVLLGSNRVTFRVQMVAPAGRWHTKRITEIEKGMVWRTVEPWHKAGWDLVLVEEQSASFGVYTAVLKRFE